MGFIEDNTESTAVNNDLVDEAVTWIRQKAEATVHKGMAEIGAYLLDRFFDGNPELVHSRNPSKDASFRALAERCGTSALPFSKTSLSNAVGIAVMSRKLASRGTAFKQLPPSLQETLLPLHDLEQVERFAERATHKAWSLRELRLAVAEERANTPKLSNGRGRPPTPLVLKALGQAERAFLPISKAHAEALQREQRRAALSRARTVAAQVEELIGLLEA